MLITRGASTTWGVDTTALKNFLRKISRKKRDSECLKLLSFLKIRMAQIIYAYLDLNYMEIVMVKNGITFLNDLFY